MLQHTGLRNAVMKSNKYSPASSITKTEPTYQYFQKKFHIGLKKNTGKARTSNSYYPMYNGINTKLLSV